MLKKLLIVGGGVLLVLFLLLGRGMVSHVKTAVNNVQEWVDDQQSPEYRLDRAKDQLRSLHEEILKEREAAAGLEHS